MYIMMTYKTLGINMSGYLCIAILSTYLTAGARDARFTVANPAALTAHAWSVPMTTRTPGGIDMISGLPRSRTRKQNQSVRLKATDELYEAAALGRITHFSESKTVNKNQV